MRSHAAVLLWVSLVLAACFNPVNAANYERDYDAGLAALNRGEWQNAKAAFSRAVLNAQLGHLGAKEESGALYNFGLAAGQLCEYDLARQSFERALELEEEAEGPNGGFSTKRIFELARLNLDTGHYDQAVIWYERGFPLVRQRAVDRSDPIRFANELDDFATALEHTGNAARAAELRKEGAELRAQHPGAEQAFVARHYPTDCAKS